MQNIFIMYISVQMSNRGVMFIVILLPSLSFPHRDYPLLKRKILCFTVSQTTAESTQATIFSNMYLYMYI